MQEARDLLRQQEIGAGILYYLLGIVALANRLISPRIPLQIP